MKYNYFFKEQPSNSYVRFNSIDIDSINLGIKDIKSIYLKNQIVEKIENFKLDFKEYLEEFYKNTNDLVICETIENSIDIFHNIISDSIIKIRKYKENKL